MVKITAVLNFLLGYTFVLSSLSLSRCQVWAKARPRSQNSFIPYRRPTDDDDRPVWGVGGSNNPPGDRNQGFTARPSAQPIIRNLTTLPPNLALRINRAKCQEYCQFSSPEPARAKRHWGPTLIFVDGGEDSKINEFPHMVALGFGTPGGPVAWNSCGGTLISEWYVLTAAHCTDSDLGPPFVLRLGAHNVQQNPYTGDIIVGQTKVEDINVADIILHPDYQGTRGDQSLYNDIALIRMERAVKFRTGVQPACLHDEENIRAPTAVATGWGNLGFTDSPGDILQKVSLDIIPHLKCRELISSDSSIPKGVLETQVCAGILAGGHDTCPGDSGGPLQINNTITSRPGFVCGMQVVGVTSLGKACAEKDSPGVYTRVAPFVPWIENIVWGSGSTQPQRRSRQVKESEIDTELWAGSETHGNSSDTHMKSLKSKV